MKETFKIVILGIVIIKIIDLGVNILNIKEAPDLFMFLAFLMIIQGIVFLIISMKTRYSIAIFEIIITNLVIYLKCIFIFKKLDVIYKYFSYEELGALAWNGSFAIIIFSTVFTVFSIISYLILRRLIEYIKNR